MKFVHLKNFFFFLVIETLKGSLKDVMHASMWSKIKYKTKNKLIQLKYNSIIKYI